MTTISILGVRFCTDGPVLPTRLSEAGLVVVPSGPGLAGDLINSKVYREALAGADWVIPDSGLMVLVWNALHWRDPSRKINRYSGLRLLREALPRFEIRAAGATFWVMPSKAEEARNLAWLQANGFSDLTTADCYVAPMYRSSPDGGIEDALLIERLEASRPKFIFLNIGGGVQEQLGWFLRERLSYRPAIICTGAAIAFLTGGQAPIPPWADRFYLGWLLRILRDPRKFGRRYWDSVGLVSLILRHRDRSPVPD